MKVSENWLREHIHTSLDNKQLADKLTYAGLEVDSISPVAGAFDGVIVAEVLEAIPHPGADKLSLCKVNTGIDTLSIVCGASNVRAGLKVALATIGATLPGGFKIKEAKLRGELSQGMLCSASELGLTDNSEGIIELDADAPLGKDLRDYLSLNDEILDIELTPNRADCLSIIGIARDIAALTNTPFSLPSRLSSTNQPTSHQSKTIHIMDEAACPCYCGVVITKVNSKAETPLWMREKLRRSGIRSIHPIVDITQYVMLELGQPLHAFDLSTIQGDIYIRRAKEGETLTLLDNQSHTFQGHELLIADAEKPLALAGIMGGDLSSVQEETIAIFLESAYFDAKTIAATARSHHLLTDASQRYERGVDFLLAPSALEYAISLIKEIMGAEIGPISISKNPSLLPCLKPIIFRLATVKQLTGLDISEQAIETMLSALGLTIEKTNTHWEVIPPSYRYDLRIEADLVEEVVRLYGYDKIIGEPMTASLCSGSTNELEQLRMQLSSVLVARGFNEMISYSFVDPELQQALYPDSEALKILNPISSELSDMRVGLWPGLLASMLYNLNRQQTYTALFESGVIFTMEDGKLTEEPCFAGLLTGESASLNWLEPTRAYDFYDIKGLLQALFNQLHIESVVFKAATHPSLHPGKSAKMFINEQFIGWCGVLHPRLTQDLDLREEVTVFELRLNGLQSKRLHYEKISKYPQIRRDLSLIVDESICFSAIEQAVKEAASNEWLQSVHVFDVYRGSSIPPNKKSLALTLILQNSERTLIDSEINELIDAILKKLHEKLAITLRD